MIKTVSLAAALVLGFRAGNAVEARKARIGNADVSVRADDRPADGAAIALDEGIELGFTFKAKFLSGKITDSSCSSSRANQPGKLTYLLGTK